MDLYVLQMNSDEPFFETVISCQRQRPHFSLKAARKVKTLKEKQTDSKENETDYNRSQDMDNAGDASDDSARQETDYNSQASGCDSPLSFVPHAGIPSTRGKRGAHNYYEVIQSSRYSEDAASDIDIGIRKPGPKTAVELEWHPPILPPIPSSPPSGAILPPTSRGLIAPPNSPTPWALGGEMDVLLKPIRHSVIGLGSEATTIPTPVPSLSSDSSYLQPEQSSDLFCNMGIEHVYIGGTRLKTKRRLSIEEDEKQNKETTVTTTTGELPLINDHRKRKRKGSRAWTPYVVCPEVGCSFLAQNQTALAAHRDSVHKVASAILSPNKVKAPEARAKTRKTRSPAPPANSPATATIPTSVVKTCSVSLDVDVDVSAHSPAPEDLCAVAGLIQTNRAHEIEVPKAQKRQLKKIKPSFDLIPMTETLPPRALFPPPDFTPRTSAQRKRLLARSAAAS
jgi:hypothetical protein